VIRRGPSPTDARLVAVAVHGRDEDPATMVELLVDPLGLADVAWVLPAAPERSWYPERFSAPLADNQPDLDHALATLDSIAAELADAGVPPERIVWAGFSQGAGLVTQWVADHPERWGGLLAFTGGLLGPAGTAMWIAPVLDGMPAYFGVGNADAWMPLWRVDETVAAFEEAGAEVTLDVFDDAEHTIRTAEIDRARTLLGG